MNLTRHGTNIDRWHSLSRIRHVLNNLTFQRSQTYALCRYEIIGTFTNIWTFTNINVYKHLNVFKHLNVYRQEGNTIYITLHFFGLKYNHLTKAQSVHSDMLQKNIIHQPSLQANISQIILFAGITIKTNALKWNWKYIQGTKLGHLVNI